MDEQKPRPHPANVTLAKSLQYHYAQCELFIYLLGKSPGPTVEEFKACMAHVSQMLLAFAAHPTIAATYYPPEEIAVNEDLAAAAAETYQTTEFAAAAAQYINGKESIAESGAERIPQIEATRDLTT